MEIIDGWEQIEMKYLRKTIDYVLDQNSRVKKTSAVNI
jgi:hypothetical protein